MTGGIYIKSQEGNTQGDPLAMPRYSINTNTIIKLLEVMSLGVRQVWLADHAAVGEKIQPLCKWYRNLTPD